MCPLEVILLLKTFGFHYKRHMNGSYFWLVNISLNWPLLSGVIRYFYKLSVLFLNLFPFFSNTLNTINFVPYFSNRLSFSFLFFKYTLFLRLTFKSSGKFFFLFFLSFVCFYKCTIYFSSGFSLPFPLFFYLFSYFGILFSITAISCPSSIYPTIIRCVYIPSNLLA